MLSMMGSRGNSGATDVKYEWNIILKAGLLECREEGRVPAQKNRKTFTTTRLPRWLCQEAPDNCLIAKLHLTEMIKMSNVTLTGRASFPGPGNFLRRTLTFCFSACEAWKLYWLFEKNMSILPAKNRQTKGPLLFCPSWSGTYWLIQSL